MTYRVFVVIFAFVVIATASKLPLISNNVEWKGRIIGGEEANEGQFPHIVSLRSSITNNHFCGGALISTTWVLSVAHCTLERNPNNCIIAAGSIRRTGGTVYKVAIVINHASYNANTLENDISLVQSVIPMLGINIVYRPLSSETVGPDVNVHVAGWGQTANPGSESDELLYVAKVTITNQVCRNRMGALGPDIVDQKICASLGVLEGSGACMGDNGGPLTQVGGSQTIFGVLSWGVACGRGFPDVYTRVSAYRGWIIANAGV